MPNLKWANESEGLICVSRRYADNRLGCFPGRGQQVSHLYGDAPGLRIPLQGFVVIRQGRTVQALNLVVLSQQLINSVIVWIQLLELLVGSERKLHVHPTQQVEGLRIGRLRFSRFDQLSQRFGVPAEQVERPPKMEACRGVLWLCLHCLLQVCYRFSIPAQLQKTDPKKQARNKKFRIQLQGLAKCLGCLRNLVVEIVHHSQVGTRFVKTRVEFQYLSYKLAAAV